MTTISAHIVVRDPERALDWYASVLGAEERSRIPLPGGKVMTIEIAIGDSTVMVATSSPTPGSSHRSRSAAPTARSSSPPTAPTPSGSAPSTPEPRCSTRSATPSGANASASELRGFD